MSEPIVLSSEDEGEAIPAGYGEVITISSGDEAFEPPSFTPRSRRARARSRSPRGAPRANSRRRKCRARTKLLCKTDDPIVISEDEDSGDDRAGGGREADTTGLSSKGSSTSPPIKSEHSNGNSANAVKSEQGTQDFHSLVNGTSASPTSAPLTSPRACQSTLKEECDRTCIKTENIDKKPAMGNSGSSSGPDGMSGELEDRTVHYHGNQVEDRTVSCHGSQVSAEKSSSVFKMESSPADSDEELQAAIKASQLESLTEEEAIRIAIQRSLEVEDSVQNRDSSQESDDDPDLAKAIALSRVDNQPPQNHTNMAKDAMPGSSGIRYCGSMYIASSSQSSSDSAIWESMTKSKIGKLLKHYENNTDVPEQRLCDLSPPPANGLSNKTPDLHSDSIKPLDSRKGKGKGKGKGSPKILKSPVKKLSEEELEADLAVALALSQVEADTQKRLVEEEELILQKVCAESLKEFNRTKGLRQEFLPTVAGPVLQLPNGTACSTNGSDPSHLPPLSFPLQGSHLGRVSSVWEKSSTSSCGSPCKLPHECLSDESPSKRVNMTNIARGTKEVVTPSKQNRQSKRGTKVESSPTINGLHGSNIDLKMKDCRVALKRLTQEEIIRHSPKAKIKRHRVSDSDSSDWATPRKRHRIGNRKPMVLSDDSDTDIADPIVKLVDINLFPACTYADRELIKKSRCQLFKEDPPAVSDCTVKTLPRSVNKGIDQMLHVGSTVEVSTVFSDDHTSSKGQAESEDDITVISDGRVSSKDMSDDALPDLEIISYCPPVKEKYSSDDLPDLEIVDSYFPPATMPVPVKKEQCDEAISDSPRSCAEMPVQWRRKTRTLKLNNFFYTSSSASKPQTSQKKKKKTFGQHRSNMLNSCEDGEDYDTYLNLIKSFTTCQRTNSPDTTKFIIEQILLKSRSETITSEALNVLQHVQKLHPFEVKTESDAKWFWTLLQTVCKNLGLTEESATPLSTVSYYNNVQALQYVVKVCEDDLRRHLQSKSPHRSIVRQILCLHTGYRHVEELLRWTVKAVEVQQRTVTTNSSSTPMKKPPSSHRTGRSVSFGNVSPANVPSCLKSLQKLLLLVEEASDSPYNDCQKMGNELLTSYICLTRLRDCRLLLQTMQAHHLRLRFLEVMFYNKCNQYSQGVPVSIGMITSSFFKCEPRAFEVQEQGNDEMAPVREACEELTMLLFFILQSYTRVKMGRHHSVSSALRQTTTTHPTSSTYTENNLSLVDLQALELLPAEVETLKYHLEDLCSPLSHRTHSYLQQMVVLGTCVQRSCRGR